jgi:hypothetical protein
VEDREPPRGKPQPAAGLSPDGGVSEPEIEVFIHRMCTYWGQIVENWTTRRPVSDIHNWGQHGDIWV